jgi:hypothetical protein
VARKGEAEDLRLEREMLADEKERAEHIMLVDWDATIWGGCANTVRCGWKN